jgi:maleylpyruvate isomerase
VTTVPATEWAQWTSKLFLATLNGLTDADLGAPTVLPGWTRRHVLAHVASNAEALGRLLHWARTGDPTPMYASPEERDAAIEEGSRSTPDRLRDAVRTSAEELLAGFRDMTEQSWAAEVRTAHGRVVPAAEVPWMRVRELAVHAVDLDAGAGFTDLPDDINTALVTDVARWRNGRGPALSMSAGSREWTVEGSGSPVRVSGTVAELAAWLTGRPHRSDLPKLPKWL